MPSIQRIERLNYGIGAVVIAVAALTQAPPVALTKIGRASCRERVFRVV